MSAPALHLRPAQREVLRAHARARFEQEMAEHLATRAPLHARVLGAQGMINAVRFGIERALQRGYRLRGPLRLWLELMFLFGGRFDEDPVLPTEAAALVQCRDPDRELQTAAALHAIACDLLARTSGPDNAYNRAALARLEGLALDMDLAPLTREALGERLLAGFISAHPQRVEVLGETAHRRLIAHTLAQAEDHGVRCARGQALFAVLGFILGAGFAADPLYPWIARTLDDPRRPDPEQRAARLERRALIYLRRVLVNLGIG